MVALIYLVFISNVKIEVVEMHFSPSCCACCSGDTHLDGVTA